VDCGAQSASAPGIAGTLMLLAISFSISLIFDFRGFSADVMMAFRWEIVYFRRRSFVRKA
jgi:hypothetical protein